MLPQILRIIDANINRVSEGLRVLEDIARFIIEDANISQKLKLIRHELIQYPSILGLTLIASRESDADIGSNFDLTHEYQKLSSVVQANARRAQEGIRVLEEMSKLPDLNKSFSADDLKKIRFRVYLLEKQLLAKLSRKDKLEQLAGIYLIIDIKKKKPEWIDSLVSEALAGGAKVIGMRGELSKHDKAKILDLYNNVKTQCERNGSLFALHDQLDLAIVCHPDCLCIENIRTPTTILRKRLQFNAIIGRRVKTIKHLTQFVEEGLDFILLSDFTQTSNRKSVAKTEQFNLISQYASQVPLVPISGAKLVNLHSIMSTGIRCIAIDSSQMTLDNIKNEIKRLGSIIEKERKKLEKTRKNI